MTEQAAMSNVDASTGTTRRVAGLTWACVFSGLGGGFFAGILPSGYVELEVEEVATILEMGGAIVVLVPGAFALARMIGRRVRLSPTIRYGLAVTCLATGLLIGFTGPGEEGYADDAAWVSSGVGKLSLALLAFSLFSAAVASLRRYPLATDAPPEPTLEELVYGRRR